MDVNSGPFTASQASWADKVWPKAIARALAGAGRHAVKAIADALGVARSNLIAQAATAAPPWAAPAARARVADRDRQVIPGQPTYGYGRVHAPIRGHREEQAGRRSTSGASTGHEGARNLAEGNWHSIGDSKWLIAEK
jgi:hypothetical protein